jgi:hypothetical protein
MLFDFGLWTPLPLEAIARWIATLNVWEASAITTGATIHPSNLIHTMNVYMLTKHCIPLKPSTTRIRGGNRFPG